MFISPQHVRLIKRFLFLLLPYSLIRLGFYFYHHNVYQHFSLNKVTESFLLGIRFDIAALCLVNIPVILLSLIPLRKQKLITFERCTFILLNFSAIVAGLDDYELFLFMGKRLSFDFFLMANDILSQLPQVFLYYWYLPVTGIIFCIGFYFFDRKFFQVQEKPMGWLKYSLSGVLILGMSFIGIRGGLQSKSINVQSAFTQGENELGHLVLNTPYHFLRTLMNRPPTKLAYLTDEEVNSIVKVQRQIKSGVKGIKDANVVFILLESFASEYLDQGYAPFLSELKKKSLNFDRHMANGRRSIEVMPSVFCGLPSLLDEPISKSLFQGNNYRCFPQVLKDAGYTNHFFHAGSRGTMGFESYLLSHGFEKYFAKEDYPDQKDDDGTWGIFDGPYLQYVGRKIGEMKQPFLAGVFTLSSHQPYKIPNHLKAKFPEGKTEIHRSIRYTDFALRNFFESIKNEPWFSNTVFIITADHTQKLITQKYENMVGRYRVPMMWYMPKFDWNSEHVKVTQHADIPNSVLDFVEVNGELPAMGNSIFVHDDGAAINFADGASYILVSNSGVLSLDKNQEQVHFDYDWEKGELLNKRPSDSKVLKAYLQYFFNGLIKNNLSL
jgi:phosphoglycerol transferase MdoB-like AlkP superfamily enzyme